MTEDEKEEFGARLVSHLADALGDFLGRELWDRLDSTIDGRVIIAALLTFMEGAFDNLEASYRDTGMDVRVFRNAVDAMVGKYLQQRKAA